MNDVAHRIAAARQVKAQRLAAVLIAAGVTVEHFDRDAVPWDLAVQVSGVNAPSDETKAMVRSMVAFTERVRELPNIDPFAGLG